MSVKKRTFTKEEKVKILKEAESNGVQVTLDKYGVYPATYYNWKKKFESMGDAGFRHGMTPEHLKEIRRLEKENDYLKKIIAEKELEARLKDDLLKKKYPCPKKKN
ncbi:transposase [Cytophagaceae bacterium ABcell3]|nr:transposase [Cytophagaceae bacterium ABcell3]WMJ74113.1 transposase [Cytophagaceae bacterium ABcell3]WMJ74870.1 transposase [Cytophagaceae bacterium ABcell3]WMJ75001.1 transposase [Cytophagaceae bacterium ABcell3]WMJ75076.1 transposase [Cytophagaceae bacterium ABcell3]